jgi:hypothetical protein
MRQEIISRLRLAGGRVMQLGMDDQEGAFVLPFRGRSLRIIASHGMDWDHVSVSLENRCPNWEEMCFIKSVFFDDEETVMELHVPRSKWINNHPYCLHLWRPQREAIPLPPDIMVGIKEMGTADTTKKKATMAKLFRKLNDELSQEQKGE